MLLSPEVCQGHFCRHRLQTGSGIYFKGPPIQRGNGIFDFLRGPIPILRKAGKYLGGKALELAAKVGSDLVKGKSFKESALSRLKETGSEIKQDVIQRVQSGGNIRKRSRRAKSKRVKKSRKNDDIFS